MDSPDRRVRSARRRLRIAFTELVKWIEHDDWLSSPDAYELLSKGARIRLSEMVDPNNVIVASIDERYLPPPRAAPGG